MSNQLLQTLPSTIFLDPPSEFAAMPFWFWNDDLDDNELLRHIREFHAKGFAGFLIHPRIGLSRRIGYLTDEYFRLVRLAVSEAARLGMKVVLYDEGSYPSGSAQGKVVAEDPTFAARGLIAQQKSLSGPARGYWHPNPGRALTDELLCVVAAREIAPDIFDPDSLITLPVQQPELVCYDLPAGEWRLVAIWHVYSGGTIRGLFADEDDQHALAPPAGDLLNPAAVDCFLRLTHEQYFTHVGDYFGDTIVAMFTDEPSVLGRGAKRGPNPWPYTPGFFADVEKGWGTDVLRWLPALWIDCGSRGQEFRQHYTSSIYARLASVFYDKQSHWCAAHGIALTGHPAESNDFGALRYFQWPGQDMVWRWVTPGSSSALEGPHSCAPKCASSAAALQGSPRNVSEVLGAYGWQLTLDETKWLIDWHVVRGTNLFFLHAAFYSLRGRRAYESEPDIALHNLWWPYFRLIADYVRRLCWLLSDSEEICDVAVLTDANHAAWTAAKVLYQNQIDFLYIDEAALERAQTDGNQLVIGSQRFRAILCDLPKHPLWEGKMDQLENDSPLPARILSEFVAAGGSVINNWQSETLLEQLTRVIKRDVICANQPDLRVIHVRKTGWKNPTTLDTTFWEGVLQDSDVLDYPFPEAAYDFYLLVNEGENQIEGELSLGVMGAVECWDPLDGSTQPWPAVVRNGYTHTRLRLERRQSLILAVDAQRLPEPTLAFPPTPGAILAQMDCTWRAQTPTGDPLVLPCPGDWAHLAGWETFAGTLHFYTQFSLAARQLNQPLFLDLGQVGDIAEVLINGVVVGVCAWSPYLLRIDGRCRAGLNQLEVRVTNSIANFYEGLQLPSGLIGPVVIRCNEVSG